MIGKDLLKVLDHTFLKDEKDGVSEANQREFIGVWVDRATSTGCYAICVRDRWTEYARKLLDQLQSSCKLAVTIGFPDGDSNSTVEKIESIRRASLQGADEFDTVLRVTDLKARRLDSVYLELKELSQVCADKILKVILEVDRLSPEEKGLASFIALQAFQDAKAKGIRFLKTSTGFVSKELGPKGATLEDLLALKQWTQGKVGIKASGGVGTVEKGIQFASLFEDGLNPLKFRIGSSTLIDSIFEVKKESQSEY